MLHCIAASSGRLIRRLLGRAAGIIRRGPRLLQWLAAVNPLYYASDAARALLEGRLGDGSIPLAFASFVVLAALTLLWFIRTTREAVA